MKLITVPLDESIPVNEVIHIDKCAFSSITFGDDKFLYINFECLDEDHMLFYISFPMIVDYPEEFELVKEFYEYDLAPTGLGILREKIPSLMVTEHFKKFGNNSFSVGCIDSKSNELYMADFSREQFLLSMAIIHDVFDLKMITYQSHPILYYLPEDANTISIDASNTFDIVGVNIPKNIPIFGDPNKEFGMQVLLKTTINNELIHIFLNLSYKRTEIRNIQKKCTIPTVDLNNIDKENLYIVSDYTMVEYSISAKNPMSKMIWIAEGNSNYKVFSMLTTDYINIMQYINEKLLS